VRYFYGKYRLRNKKANYALNVMLKNARKCMVGILTSPELYLNELRIIEKCSKQNVMTKLTKYNSYKDLKLSAESNLLADKKNFSPTPELEAFFNQLRRKLIKAGKVKNNKS
jgi:hypothetical protein